LITESLLSLLPDGIVIDRVEVSSGLVTVHARSADLIACCPLCAMPSERIHGRYIRHVANLPIVGSFVSLSLQIRRFHCSRAGCSRRIFAEQPACGGTLSEEAHRPACRCPAFPCIGHRE
jgi:transposase